MQMSDTYPTISFIGAGNMASAIIGGLVTAGHPPDQILAIAPTDRHLSNLQRQWGVGISHNNRDGLSADVIILAVKPQVMRSVAMDCAPDITDTALVVSLAAGITSAALSQWLATPDRKRPLSLVRCMPNTPLQVGLGASGLYANAQVTAQQRAQIDRILTAAGRTYWMDNEAQLDTLTAVSGSGPAYFFQFMESMIAAAEAQGMSPEMARDLTIQTALGAATLAQHSEATPAQLKQRVMSPGGTTERAIGHFQHAGMDEMVADAMSACRDRAHEMNEQLAEEPSDSRGL